MENFNAFLEFSPVKKPSDPLQSIFEESLPPGIGLSVPAERFLLEMIFV
jgi:hypothetical protein